MFSTRAVVMFSSRALTDSRPAIRSFRRSTRPSGRRARFLGKGQGRGQDMAHRMAPGAAVTVLKLQHRHRHAVGKGSRSRSSTLCMTNDRGRAGIS